ncbi:MAG TPA: aminotransferase class V-fold PLP-dependent enzyme [Candidatus Bathyarchaeia archaeon]|nr:aminotransferase class V-fold PLP-dependent enzyme [Candidatus Bathyarchaeia archaeon]
MAVRPSPWRALFPLADECVFLDHAGVAPVSLRVVEAVRAFATEAASELHRRYPYWNERAEQVRAACARLVGVEPRQLAFVKNTSEALSLVAEGFDWQPGDAVVIADQEFPSNVYPWWGLRHRGVEARMLDVEDGGITAERVEAMLDERVRMVALSAVAYGTGDRLDLEAIAARCHARDALFVVDAIQALGAVAIDMTRCGVDCVAADGHKWLCAPEGTGFVALSDALLERLRPVQLGWKSMVDAQSFYPYDFRLRSDASKLEAGSLNLLGLHALGAAVDLVLEVGIDEIESRLAGLTADLSSGLEARGRALLGRRREVASGASGIVTFVPAGAPERVRQALWARGVITKVRFGGIRLAPHYYQDASDVSRFFAALDEAEAGA